jgi:LuxR family maltose regulon positive regulatory protein
MAGDPAGDLKGVPVFVTLMTHGSTRAPNRGTATLAGDRLAVLETKLSAPFPRRGIVVRHALLERLDSIDESVVVVIAPAGYGKSTLLSQWAFRSGHPVAWLSADDRDNDPATLLRGVAAALDRTIGLEPSVIDSVAFPGPSVWSSAVPRLGAALSASPPITLCVDDVDRIGDREALDVLITLAGYLGSGSRLGVAGRGTGAFPVARLVSRGQVTAVGRESLALDLGETHAIVTAAGAALTTDEIAGLHERTEGWAAGIYLSALAARHRSGADDGSVVPLDADERLVEDYLRSEVLANAAPDDVELLLRCSVLERLSGPLCDAILERTGAGIALDRLEHSNLFLIPLDRDRTWFRFHHLLGDLLRAELARRDPDAAAEIRRRAAAWHEEQGLLEPALEYAIAAGDVDRAARLLTGIGQATLNAGRSETIRRWFGWFEARGAWKDHPRLAATASVVFALDGDQARSDRWGSEAELEDQGDPSEATALAIFTRAFRCQDGIERMRNDADLAVEAMANDDPYLIAATGIRGIAALLAGDAAGAEVMLSEAVAAWERHGGAHVAAVMCLAQLATLAMDRGDWTLAASHARRARSIAMAHGLDEQAPGAAADAVNARVALHHGAIEQARSDATHARRLRMLLTAAVPHIAIRVRLDLIRVDLALGDGGGARTLLTEVREILARCPEMGTLVEETADLERRVAQLRGGVVGASTLTLAELRLLPLLTTHLSFREIGERLFVSQNTVKTQAISIYRKLDATSRSEAVARATAMGLLDGPADDLAQGG